MIILTTCIQPFIHHPPTTTNNKDTFITNFRTRLVICLVITHTIVCYPSQKNIKLHNVELTTGENISNVEAQRILSSVNFILVNFQTK